MGRKEGEEVEREVVRKRMERKAEKGIVGGNLLK